MSKRKVIYCYDCGRDTEHKLVCKESPVTGFLPLRLLIGIVSAETSKITAESCYKCTRCGKLEKATAC